MNDRLKLFNIYNLMWDRSETAIALLCVLYYVLFIIAQQKPKSRYPCGQCEKSYVGTKSLARHFRLTGHGKWHNYIIRLVVSMQTLQIFSDIKHLYFKNFKFFLYKLCLNFKYIYIKKMLIYLDYCHQHYKGSDIWRPNNAGETSYCNFPVATQVQTIQIGVVASLEFAGRIGTFQHCNPTCCKN